MQTSNTPNLKSPTRYIHINPQSKGNLGKSLEAEMRCAWLDRHGIPWRGSDLDDRHRTFVGRHPGEVKSFELGNAIEAKAAFLMLMRDVLNNSVPVHVIDTRAQADALMTNAFEQLNFFDLCRREGVRTTFFLFPTDEMESMKNFRALIRFAGAEVNYVTVHNPMRGESKLFKNSPLEKKLEDMGGKVITLPPISSPTMLSMERAETRAGRGISFAEFASPSSEHLEPIMTGEIQWVLGHMYAQYDAIAELLMPAEMAMKIQQTTVGTTTKKKVGANDDDFGFNFED